MVVTVAVVIMVVGVLVTAVAWVVVVVVVVVAVVVAVVVEVEAEFLLGGALGLSPFLNCGVTLGALPLPKGAFNSYVTQTAKWRGCWASLPLRYSAPCFI